MSDAYTVQVAGRPALVRVFVGLTGATAQAGVTGRLTRYLGGAPQDSLTAGPITVQATTNEGDLSQTLDFSLPAAWLAPGTSYVFELDPDNAIPETNEDNNRYPPAGQAAFNFQNAPTLNVVIVPVHYARSGAPATDPPTGDLSYLTWMPIKVYPLAQVNYTVRSSSWTFSGDLRSGSGWVDLLNDITTIHQFEDPNEHKEYVGLVDSVAADGCSGGCIAGIGWVNQPPQLGFASKSAVTFAGFSSDRAIVSPIMTHEMGHNFGRSHSPCGTTVGLGPYPYAGAVIGQWGYDNATGQLKDPNTYRDYMSYCDPAWTSDFTYQAVFNAWSWVSQPFGTALPANRTDAWVLSGSFDPSGQVQVGPAHVEPVLPAQLAGGGPLRLELLDGAGAVLRSQSFGTVTLALDLFRTGFYQQGFRVALPVVPGLAGFRISRDGQVLYERRAHGAPPRLGQVTASVPLAGGQSLSWSLTAGPSGVTYRVSASLDGGQSWEVLALDQVERSITLPSRLIRAAGQAIVEVQASDGVRTDTLRFPVP